jgi:hydroxyacylglutathione hydrolase
MTEEKIYFKRLELGPMANFVYLVGDAEAKQVAVVDPAWDVNTILHVAQADDLRITDIFLTHAHPDHDNGVEELQKRSGASVWLHGDEKPWEGNWDRGAEKLKDGDQKHVGNVCFTFFHTPGHSPGSVCIQVGSRLITGDTLFVGACGRTDLPGGDPAQLFESLQRLATLPEETRVFPGHGYGATPSSTIGEEKERNPFMACSDKGRFLRIFGI